MSDDSTRAISPRAEVISAGELRVEAESEVVKLCPEIDCSDVEAVGEA